MSNPGRTKRGSAFLFLVVSIVAGCLVAGLALPLVAATAVGARSLGDNASRIGLDLDAAQQPQRSTLLASNGDMIGYFYAQNRAYVPISKIAPVMQQAIIAIEDDRFYSHGAIDLKGTLRALVADISSGGVAQGGSTLTQQYVKQVLVNEAAVSGDKEAVREATADTLSRKITEARYAVSVEQKLTKKEILERYLNIAYFGDGAYGVEAAAEHYFDTTAATLTLPQAAMLAGLVQSPDTYDPVTHQQAGIGRRNQVLTRMAELGLISRTVATAAEQTGFDSSQVVNIQSGCSASPYAFVCDYARRSLLQDSSLGSTQAEREKALDQGGLTIRTTIDESAQKAAQKAIDSVMGPTDPVIGVTDIVEPGTGKIKAMAQSRPEMGSGNGQTYYNYSASADMGGSQGFQAGSTFKAFTAAAAFAQGIPMSHRIDASATVDYTGQQFDTCDGSSTIGNWTVQNSTGVNGSMDMTRAAEYSVNNYFVQLELQVGMCNVVGMAQKLGVQSNTADAPISSYDDAPSFTLGTPEVSPLSMAGAYATFAAGGMHCNPVIIDKIINSSGGTVAAPDAQCQQVMSPEIANAVNDLLSHVIDDGTGAPARTADARPEAGKTGTIDNNAAVWFNGYTPNAEAVSMIAVDNTRKPFKHGAGLKYYTIPSTGVTLGGTGGGDAGHDLWRPAMGSYLKSVPVETFDAPPARLVNGNSSEDPHR